MLDPPPPPPPMLSPPLTALRLLLLLLNWLRPASKDSAPTGMALEERFMPSAGDLAVAMRAAEAVATAVAAAWLSSSTEGRCLARRDGPDWWKSAVRGVGAGGNAARGIIIIITVA